MISVDVDTTRLVQKLDGLAVGLRDLRPVWGKVHLVFIDFIKRLFATEGGYVGAAWAPLSPAYARWKARQGGKATKILQLTGRLQQSLTTVGHGEHVFLSGPSFAEYGTRVPYARFHQTGTKRMPRRSPIKEFSREEGGRVADIVLAYVLERTRRGGR